MKRLLLVAGLAALCTLSAACSSTSSSSSPSTSTSASPAASPPPTAAQLAPVVVQASDLSSAWTSTPHQDDPNDASDQAALVACAGGRDTSKDQVATANSPDFGLNGAQLSSSANSYKSQADLDADVALVQNPKISSCYEQLLKSQIATSLPAGTTVSAVTLTITPGSGGAAANVVGLGNGTVTLAQAGKQATLYVAVAFITGRLTEAELDLENPTQPVPAADFMTLTNTVAARAAKL